MNFIIPIKKSLLGFLYFETSYSIGLENMNSNKSFYNALSGLGVLGVMPFPGFHPGLSYFVLSGLSKDFYYNLFFVLIN